jgi:hypothetical protein
MISHIIGTLSDKQVFGLICHNYINLLYFVKRAICKNVFYKSKYNLDKINFSLFCLKDIRFLYYLQITNKLKMKSKYSILFIICHLRSVSETLCSLLIVYLFFPFSKILKEIMPVMFASGLSSWILVITRRSLYNLLKRKLFLFLFKIFSEPNGRYDIIRSVSYANGNELRGLTKKKKGVNDSEFYISYYE